MVLGSVVLPFKLPLLNFCSVRGVHGNKGVAIPQTHMEKKISNNNVVEYDVHRDAPVRPSDLGSIVK